MSQHGDARLTDLLEELTADCKRKSAQGFTIGGRGLSSVRARRGGPHRGHWAAHHAWEPSLASAEFPANPSRISSKALLARRRRPVIGLAEKQGGRGERFLFAVWAIRDLALVSDRRRPEPYGIRRRYENERPEHYREFGPSAMPSNTR